MQRLRSELTTALRRLVRRPDLTTVAVLLLAVGVGAATFVASAVDAVLSGAAPYPDPDTLLDVRLSHRRAAGSTRSMAPADYLAFERSAESFSALGAYVPFGQADLAAPRTAAGAVPGASPDALVGFGSGGSSNGGPVRVAVRRVSEGLLAALEITPEAGTLFRSEDFRPGAPPAVLLSSRLWHSRFASDPAVVGSTVLLDGEERVVRGVLPERFRIPGGEADAVLPLSWSAVDADNRSSAYLGAIGRLRPGVSLGQARVELDGIARRLEREYPETNAGLGAHAQPLHAMFTAGARRPLALLAVAAGLLLLIAALDLAGLQTVRTLDRRWELAVRLALGAPRGRLVRDLVLDGALLGLAGWGLGLAVGRAGLAVLPRIQGVYLPSGVGTGLTPAVVAWAGLVAGAAALLPVLAAARVVPDPRTVTAPGAAGGAPTRRGGGGAGSSGWLPVAQVALSCTVLVGAGWMIRSAVALSAVEPGASPERVVTFELSLPEARYGEAGAPHALFERLAERLRGRPDVVAVTGANVLPPQGGWSYGPELEGRELPDGVSLDWVVAAGEYFEALGVPVLRGRAFDRTDGPDGRPVMVLDADAARRLFGESGPRGAEPVRSSLGARVRFNERWYEVIGVVAAQASFDPYGQPTVYVAHGQEPVPGSFLRDLKMAVRVRGAPTGLLADVREEVAAVDPLLAAANVETLDRRMASGLRRVRGRFHAVLLGVLAALSLGLSAVGVFAIQAFQVGRRTREIGLRMALGARIGQVVRLVLGRGLRIAVLGTGLGVLGALLLSDLVEHLLYGVEPVDPLTLVGVVGVLVLTVLAASTGPAVRAARVDPMSSLRSE